MPEGHFLTNTFLMLFFPIHVMTQVKNSNDSLPGEYELRGVHEMASIIRLNADSSFDFFFSYGALDREGKGRWHEGNGTVELQSRSAPGHGFTLEKSQHASASCFHISVQEKNSNLFAYLYCTLHTPSGEITRKLDSHGSLYVDAAGVSSITMVFELCPDNPSSFPIIDPTLNELVFTMNPSLFEVYFNHLVLKVRGRNLEGPHPLLNGNDFTYERSD